MRRVLLIAVVFLLLGAVVNVGVAWGLALRYTQTPWSPEFIETSCFFPAESPKWNVGIVEHLGRKQVTSSSLAGASPALLTLSKEDPPNDHLIPKWAAARAVPIRPSHRWGEHVYVDDAWGWPLASLRSRMLLTFSEAYFGVVALEGGLLWNGLWRSAFEPCPLPLLPLWPGFAINTLFYAVILWLLIPGPFVLRRFIRRKRGLCPKCAYPVGESAGCTECGQELAT